MYKRKLNIKYITKALSVLLLFFILPWVPSEAINTKKIFFAGKDHAKINIQTSIAPLIVSNRTTFSNEDEVCPTSEGELSAVDYSHEISIEDEDVPSIEVSCNTGTALYIKLHSLKIP